MIEKNYSQNNLMPLNKQQWMYVQKRYNLTARERQIAELICQGFGNNKISKNLRIKLGTVKTHTRNIYRKVRVRNKIKLLLTFIDDINELSGRATETALVSKYHFEKS